MTPNFFIIGTPKAGTTSLYHYLREHPQIYMSPLKEPRYFDHDNKDWAGYLTSYDGVQHELAIGEASPQYLFSREAPARIKRRVPEAKLIIILRQPVDRAYSHFIGYKSRGLELETSFEKAFQQGEEKWRIKAKIGWQYKLLGYYTSQIENYLNYFDKSRIKVCLFDDLLSDPYQVIKDLYTFLEVETDFLPNVGVKYNVKKNTPRSLMVQILLQTGLLQHFGKIPLPSIWKNDMESWISKQNVYLSSPLTAEVRQRLGEYYRTDIMKLQLLINRDLTHWLP